MRNFCKLLCVAVALVSVSARADQLVGTGSLHTIGSEPGYWGVAVSTIVAGNFGGTPGRTDLLLYYGFGAGQFRKITAPGSDAYFGADMTGWRASWTIIVPGDFGGGTGRNDLLFYDRTTGEGAVYAVTSAGGIKPLGATNAGWRKSWTIIVPGNFGSGSGRTDLLFFDPTMGEGAVYAVTSAGGIKQIGTTNTGWRKSWTIIVPGNFGSGSGRTDLLFYDPTAGEGAFYAANGTGGFAQIGKTSTGWRKSWMIVVPGNFGGGTARSDLLFYDPTVGEGAFYTTTTPGVIAQIGKTNSGWRTSWTSIVPGSFGGRCTTDLVFYGNSGPVSETAFYTTSDASSTCGGSGGTGGTGGDGAGGSGGAGPPPCPSRTCLGTCATQSAGWFRVLVVDSIKCGNTWLDFGNSADDVKQCAKARGYKPVDDLCEYDVQYFRGVDTYVVSDTEANAVSCAKYENGGCTNCDTATVIGKTGCSSDIGAARGVAPFSVQGVPSDKPYSGIRSGPLRIQIKRKENIPRK